MLKNSYKMMFLITLTFGTIISISSSSWFGIWMGLEINLLSFIPLMTNSNNLFSSEASLKYFLIQALASSVLLFSMINFYFFIEFNYQKKLNMLMNLIFLSTLMMKSGVAPFHFWFPNVMEGLNWINNFILMTWQKIAPMIILSFCMNYFMFNVTILFSIFIGAIGGLNQTSLRKIMAFSSINHLGWLMSNMMNNENLWKIYFLFYSFLSFSVIFLFNKFNIFNMNQMYSFKTNNKMQKLFFSFPLLSMGGLPPFLGFFPKWLTIEMMITNNFIFLMIMMTIFSLLTLYFYSRITFSSLLLNHNSMNYNFYWYLDKKNKNLTFMNSIIFFSTFGILLINFMFLFF